ncbi:replication initiation factor domain-containing protein [Oscillospiraceae bacterium 42-9]
MNQDQFTLDESFDWIEAAGAIIERFISKADFLSVYGEIIPEKRAPQGYTTAVTFGEHPFYLAVAYHELYRSMGVIVKFSAQALDYYCEAKGITLYRLLQAVRDSLYTMRLSRIDLTADFIDEDINPTKIYDDLKNQKVAVFREYESKKNGETVYKKNPMKLQGFAVETEMPTIYLGSSQSNSQLRIYDKKKEQIDRHGTKYDKAIQCKSWVRFEGIFRHEFAHQISDELLTIKNDNEFANMIACALAQKFRLMYVDKGVVDCDTEYTQQIIDGIHNGSFTLTAPSSRTYQLEKNLAYLFTGSGIISTLYKVKSIWGDPAMEEFYGVLLEFLKNWVPTEDCKHWVRVYTEAYKTQHPDFNLFISSALAYIFIPLKARNTEAY